MDTRESRNISVESFIRRKLALEIAAIDLLAHCGTPRVLCISHVRLAERCPDLIASSVHLHEQLRLTQLGARHPRVSQHLVDSNAGRGVHGEHAVHEICIDEQTDNNS
jgi:hypothetical protein